MQQVEISIEELIDDVATELAHRLYVLLSKLPDDDPSYMELPDGWQEG